MGRELNPLPYRAESLRTGGRSQNFAESTEAYLGVNDFYPFVRAELYDVVGDVEETRNLAEAKPDLTQQLKSRLMRWLKETNAGLPQRLD